MSASSSLLWNNDISIKHIRLLCRYYWKILLVRILRNFHSAWSLYHFGEIGLAEEVVFVETEGIVALTIAALVVSFSSDDDELDEYFFPFFLSGCAVATAVRTTKMKKQKINILKFILISVKLLCIFSQFISFWQTFCEVLEELKWHVTQMNDFKTNISDDSKQKTSSSC